MGWVRQRMVVAQHHHKVDIAVGRAAVLHDRIQGRHRLDVGIANTSGDSAACDSKPGA